MKKSLTEKNLANNDLNQMYASQKALGHKNQGGNGRTHWKSPLVQHKEDVRLMKQFARPFSIDMRK